jgi:SAM-dependent methyltransferase
LEILIIISALIALLFSAVVAFGAPFLPTLSKRVDDAILLLELKPGQTFLELGCGDGRLLKAAAKKGINSIGYELNPILVIYAWISNFRYRKFVTVRWGNYWKVNWPKADGMYVFLLNPYMSKLHNKVVQYTNDSKFTVVSFAFKIPQKEPSREINSMFQYKYGKK